MILKWFGTVTVLLLIISAADAREQSSEQSSEQSPDQPEAQSSEQSEAKSAEQPAEQSGEQSSTQLPEQSPANAYRLTVTIHGSFGLCGDDEFGSQELYVVVKRLDLELQDQIDDTEREAQQITGRMSWWHAERRVDSLRKQDFNSRSDPLSEAELESLEGLRRIRPSERTADEVQEFRSLQARAPISSANASVLARMKELKTQRRRLLRRIQMRSSATKPGSLRVYPDDELQVVLMEDDPFFDDTCFGSTVVLDQSVLAMRPLEVKKDDKILLTLNLTMLDR